MYLGCYAEQETAAAAYDLAIILVQVSFVIASFPRFPVPHSLKAVAHLLSGSVRGLTPTPVPELLKPHAPSTITL